MIVTVLGGSAQSTPMLIDLLARSLPNVPITFRLAGRDLARLAAVQRASEILCRGTRISPEQFGEAQWPEALRGSDVILVQPRVGYYKGRQFDEQFSLEYGIPGDEGLGPGGLSAAYRAWPELKVLFRDIISYAPNAKPILLTSPVSLLVRLASMEFPGWPLVGTCELPFTTLLHLCSVQGKHYSDVTFGYTGVNHLGFFYDVENGDDLVGSYSRRARSADFPTPALVAKLQAYPLKYLRMHYDPATCVIEQQRQVVSRAQQLASIAKSMFQTFRSGDETSIRQSLGLRPAPWYQYAVLPLLQSYLGEPVAEPLFLTSASENGEVLERVHQAFDRHVVPRAPEGLPPDHIADLIETFSNYEQMAALAVLQGTARALSEALQAHPWVAPGCAHHLAKKIVDQHREYPVLIGDDLCPN